MMARRAANALTVSAAIREGVQSVVTTVVTNVERQLAGLFTPIQLAEWAPTARRRRRARIRLVGSGETEKHTAPGANQRTPDVAKPASALQTPAFSVRPTQPLTPDEKWEQIEASRRARQASAPPAPALPPEPAIPPAPASPPKGSSFVPLGEQAERPVTWEGAFTRHLRESSREAILAARPVTHIDPVELLLLQWGEGWLRPSWR